MLGQSSRAETAYVTDSTKVNIRSGPSLEHRIIATLESGEPLEVLGTEDDWSHVRLRENGESSNEGYILSRYLITRLPWEMKAKSLIDENMALRKKLAPIEKTMNESVLREQDLSSKLKMRTEELDRIKQELESIKQGAADYLNLMEKHKTIQNQLEITLKKNKELTEENIRFKSSQTIKWFLAGGIVLFCGLIIGLLLGSRKRSYRSSY